MNWTPALYVSFCWTRLTLLLVNSVRSDTAARPAFGTLIPWRTEDDLLRGIPGVGAVATLILLAKCPEVGTLNRREIAAFTGVTPLAKESGKNREQRFIWCGRADVRAVLYMATISAMRCNDTIRELAERLRNAGKPPKVVIVACMRKLLTIMNSMLQNNTPWDAKFA